MHFNLDSQDAPMFLEFSKHLRASVSNPFHSLYFLFLFSLKDNVRLEL